MIAQCANPHCTSRLQHLHEGRFFATSPHPVLRDEGQIEYMWLCNQCSETMTIDLWGKLVTLQAPRGFGIN